MPTRINKYIAQSTGLGRRAADTAIKEGRVALNGRPALLGDSVSPDDTVALDGATISAAVNRLTIILNKPPGYVCSRAGQGSKTVYDLLPAKYHDLKPVGRLDKHSSGLLLLTNDGDLANELTHPRYSKTKIYEVELDKPLQPLHQQMINDRGLNLEDGLSKLRLEKLDDSAKSWLVIMNEGRNRQIRRTFDALDYAVVKLHRTHFGNYSLSSLKTGEYQSAP